MTVQRRYLRETHLTILGELADCETALGDPSAAIAVCRQALLAEPEREDVHRRLMEAYARVGQRAQALRQFALCADVAAAAAARRAEPRDLALPSASGGWRVIRWRATSAASPHPSAGLGALPATAGARDGSTAAARTAGCIPVDLLRLPGRRARP